VHGQDDKLWLFWRTVNSTTEIETLYLSKSADGIAWSPKLVVLEALTTPLPHVLSPTFVLEYGAWTMWVVDMSTTPNTLVRRRSSSAELTVPADWAAPVATSVSGIAAGKEPWHVQIRRVGGQYIALLTVCDVGTSGAGAYIQVLVSNDGKTWTGAGASAIPTLNPGQHDRLYRASFVPEFVGGMLKLRTWYSAVNTIASGVNSWNVFLTDLESSTAGGPVIKLPSGRPVPEGTPANRSVVSLHSGAAAEVVRNYTTNSAPTTIIDYWGEGFWGTGGAGTFTRETVGGPVKGVPAWAKKTWTVAATSTTNYGNYGSSTVETMDATDSETWTYTAWLFTSYAGSTSSVRLLFYDAAGALIGGSEVLGMYYPHAAGKWERRYLTVQPPAGAVRAAIRGYFQNIAPKVGDVTGMSSLMATKGTVLYDYHDGAYSPSAGLTASWTGTAYASPSILTATRSYIQFWDGIKAWTLS
jgi:hypothetical protein